METKVFGAGSYPEAPESEYKSYEVEFEAVVHCTARVQVKDSFEVEEELSKMNCCDIDKIDNLEIVEILEVKEED